MNSKTILIACDTKHKIDWHLIKPLQGNYKKRTPEQVEKLCSLIIRRGIRFPSFIAKIGKEVYAIDTHGRLLAFAELERRGYTIPLIPVVYIQAKDKKEAKQLLLECDSRYGSTTQEGFEEFIEDLDLSAFENEAGMDDFYDNLELPNIDIGRDYEGVNTEITFVDDEVYKVTLNYDSETYDAVKYAMEKRKESPEEIFKEALGV